MLGYLIQSGVQDNRICSQQARKRLDGIILQSAEIEKLGQC